MTTIAYREGVMACDTQGSWSGDLNFGNVKIGITRNFMMGFAGRFSDARIMYDWVEGLDELGTKPNQFYRYAKALEDHELDIQTLLVDKRDQAVWALFDTGRCAPLRVPYDAIGSGGRFALGAMAFGASAREGVLAAIQHDESSGGEALTFTFEDDPFPPF